MLLQFNVRPNDQEVKDLKKKPDKFTKSIHLAETSAARVKVGQHLKEFILGTWGITRFRNIARLFFYVNCSAVCQQLARLSVPQLSFWTRESEQTKQGGTAAVQHDIK